MRHLRGLIIALVVVLPGAGYGSAPAHAVIAEPESALAGTVTVVVQGQGSVTGDGINCTQSGGPDCSQAYPDQEVCEWDPETRREICFSEPPFVEFTAGPDGGGYALDGWTGCESISGRVCGLTVTASTTVTARFRDVEPPSVSAPSPSGGIQRGTITLSASASDNSGVQRVEFHVRGVLVATDTTAPYSVAFNTASVTDGPAQLIARAFDGSGNVTTSSGSSLTIDNTAPVVTVTGGPDAQTFGTGSTQTWTFSASDATSGVAAVECSVVPASAAPSFGACSGGTTSHSVSNRPHGTYTFTVRARDGGGLTTTAGSRTFSIDGTPPETTITGGPGQGATVSQTAATFTFSADEGGSTFGCRVYLSWMVPPAFGPCSGPSSHTAAGLAQGTYTFDVRATDGYGNADPTAASRTWTVDTTPPETTITGAPSGSTTAGSASISFSSSEAGSTFACSLDGAAFAPCASPYALTNLAAGAHVFRVRAADQAGNEDFTPAEATWTVADAAAPNTRLLAAPPRTTRARTASFRFASTEAGSTFQCKLDRGRWAACRSPKTYRNLKKGLHTFQVRAIDASGNVDGTPVRKTWRIR